MIKWALRLILIGIVGMVGYTVFDWHRGGFFSLPELPDDSYIISFRNGLRGIVFDAEVSDPSVADHPKFLRTISLANPDRRYLGVPFDVAPWMEDAWSTCAPPSEEERAYFQETMPEDYQQKLAYARLDAVCLVEIDSKEVLRGLVYSVPKL